jgi:hypothetical protein
MVPSPTCTPAALTTMVYNAIERPYMICKEICIHNINFGFI